MAKPKPMPSCPMAETCKEMMEKPIFGVALIVPGILYITLVILIVIEPKILVCALSAVFVVPGITMLMMSSFIRKMGMGFQNVHKQSV